MSLYAFGTQSRQDHLKEWCAPTKQKIAFNIKMSKINH